MDADMLRRQMVDFLVDNDLGDYEDSLVDDGFDDMEALLAILEEDIDAIGFTIADKRKLMNAVEKFRLTDLEYELSDDDSDLERRDEDEIDAEMGSDAEDAEDEIRKLRGEALSTAYPKAGIRRVMPILKGHDRDCALEAERIFRSPVRLCECTTRPGSRAATTALRTRDCEGGYLNSSWTQPRSCLGSTRLCVR